MRKTAAAVGFGGSMIWFGSSDGVAVSNLLPEAKSAAKWLRAAWWVPVSYVIGFFFALATVGWRPEPRAVAVVLRRSDWGSTTSGELRPVVETRPARDVLKSRKSEVAQASVIALASQAKAV